MKNDRRKAGLVAVGALALGCFGAALLILRDGPAEPRLVARTTTPALRDGAPTRRPLEELVPPAPARSQASPGRPDATPVFTASDAPDDQVASTAAPADPLVAAERRDGAREERLLALDSLVESRPETATTRLAALALGDPDVVVARRAIIALQELALARPALAAPTRSALLDIAGRQADPDARALALAGLPLARLTAAEAQQLSLFLDDVDPRVREACACALNGLETSNH